MFGGLNAAGSGLAADQVWMRLVGTNLANANDATMAGARPYRALEPVMQASFGQSGLANGVAVTRVVASAAPPGMVYAPGVRGANAQGYVAGSNVNLSVQMVDLLAAGRAYQANAAAFQAAKAEDQAAVQI